MDGRGAALVLFLLLAFAWRCSAQLQCFRMQNCASLLQTDITARECCLSDDGAFFQATAVVEQCSECLVFGWKKSDAMEPLPDVIEVSKGQVVDLTIGYIKGSPNRRRLFQIQSPPGVTVNPQEFTLSNSITVQVEVLDDGQPVTEDRNFVLTLVPDRTPEENEFLFGTANLFLPGATQCPALVDPANGMVMLTGNRPGDNATYTCDAGFMLVGDAVLTCQDDGTWSDVPPNCQATQCPALVDPANGMVMLTGNRPGDNAIYTCDGGFTLVGDAVLTCQDDGTWSDVPPTCQATRCPALVDPANGMVMLTGNRPGDNAIYTCDGGFTLVGDAVLTCQDDGTWSDVPPTCQEVTIGFEEMVYSVLETAGRVVVPVLLDGELSSDVTVRITTQDGSATGSDDYGTVDQILTFGPGRSNRVDVPITIISDALNEMTLENFFANLELITPGADVNLIPDRTEIRIRDIEIVKVIVSLDSVEITGSEEEGAVSVCVTATDATSTTFSVSLTAIPGTAEAEDFVFDPLSLELNATQSTECVDVGIVRDGIYEIPENFSIELNAPADVVVAIGTTVITILDSDTAELQVQVLALGTDAVPADGVTVMESGGPRHVAYTLVSQRGVGEGVVVRGTITTQEGSAKDGSDFEGLSISAMWRSRGRLIVNVVIIDDDVLEVDEGFVIEKPVITESPGRLTVTATQINVTILDDDEAAVSVEPGSEMVTEGDTLQRMVCLQLGNSSIPVAVSSTVDSSSTADTGDVMFDSMQLTLEPDSDPACLMYSVNDDVEVEGTETLRLVWSTTQPRVIFEPDTFILIIEDNDETSSPTPPPVSPSPPPDSVIDVVSGDPMFTVPINARSGTFTPGSVSLCYEIHGEDGQFFNLISDSCLSVNAHYARPHLSLPVNVMDQIAVVATNNDGENVNISINHQCRAQVNEIDLVYFNSSGIVVLAVGSQVIVTVGNCNDEAVVMSVTCEQSDIGNGNNTLITDMLRFSVYRGLALRESSHGLLGQFWNIPINVSHFTGDLYLVSIGNRDNQPTRQFVGSLYNFTWQLEKKECLYVGDRQGAKEAGFHGGPNDAVIEGVYSSYKVDGPFETYFEFSQFGK